MAKCSLFYPWNYSVISNENALGLEGPCSAWCKRTSYSVLRVQAPGWGCSHSPASEPQTQEMFPTTCLPSESWESIWKREDVTETRATVVQARAGKGDWGTTEKQSAPLLKGHSTGATGCVQAFRGALIGPHSHPAGSSDLTMRVLAQRRWWRNLPKANG